MALALRPNCEYCDKDLPPAARDAFICTFECTFCADCVESKLFNVCPNCGGELVRRPIRPMEAYRPGEGLRLNPAGTARRHVKYSRDSIAELSARLKDVPAHLR